MRAISFVIIMLLLGGNVIAQTKEEKKAAKKAKKEAKVQADKENTAVLMEIVESKKFVLEANTIYYKNGNSQVVSSNLNYVGFDGLNSTIELPIKELAGWDGVAGMTVYGKITKMEIIPYKDGVGFNVYSAVQNKGGGIVTLVIKVNSSGNARVDMSSSFGESISFHGNLIALDKSQVYRSTPIF